MTPVIMALMMMAGAVAQSVAPPFTVLAQAKVPVLMSLVIYYALARERGVMVCSAITAGLIEDALSFSPLGYTACLFCVIGFMLNRVKDVVASDSPFAAAFLGGLLGGSAALVTYFLLGFDETGGAQSTLGWMTVRTLGAGLLGALVTPLTVLVMRRVERLLGTVPKKEA